MRQLIIGDIHTKVNKIEYFLKEYEKSYDSVIFLGDYFDDFDDTLSIAMSVALWLKESLQKENRIYLWGNHDLHYRFPGTSSIIGSGFSISKSKIINSILKKSDWNKLKFYYESQGFLFSHAGFNRSLLHPIYGFDKDWVDTLIDGEIKELNLENNKCKKLSDYSSSPAYYFFGIGKSRRGNLEKGGILWQDWDQDFEPIEKLHQIVGHTQHDTLQFKIYNDSVNICIDTGLNYVLEIEDGKIKEIKL